MAATTPRTIQALAAYEPGLTVKPFEYVSRPLGPKDVEIKISHCAICGSDFHAIMGGWGGAKYPVVPGHEIVGEITVVGPEVTHLKVGDRVGVGAMVFSCRDKAACVECAEDLDPFCSKAVFTYNCAYPDGAMAYGGYAEYVRVDAHYAFKIPTEIPSDLAAPLLCAGVTVYTPLKKYLQPGQHVGVVGIGGLGHLALQFITALGGIPVAISHSPDKEPQARALGATEFVVMSDSEQVQKAARSVHVLIITADAKDQPYDTYMTFLKPRGTVIMVGLPHDKIQFTPFSLILSRAAVVGSAIGGIKDTVEMLALAAAKNIRPIIQKMPMKDANHGLELVHQGKVRFRVVLEN